MESKEGKRSTVGIGIGVGVIAVLIVASIAFGADAANEIVAPRAWEVLCADQTHDGGVTLAPVSGAKPRNSFIVKNAKEDGSDNAKVIFIGAPGAVNSTTGGYPLAVGEALPVDGDPANLACRLAPDAGVQTIELLGGSR